MTTQLSQNLTPIYEIELRLGNVVQSIDEPAGSKCPLALNFLHQLHIAEIRDQIALPASVEYWENRDSHYPMQNGYRCNVTGHVISGPLPTGRGGW